MPRTFLVHLNIDLPDDESVTDHEAAEQLENDIRAAVEVAIDDAGMRDANANAPALVEAEVNLVTAEAV